MVFTDNTRRDFRFGATNRAEIDGQIGFVPSHLAGETGGSASMNTGRILIIGNQSRTCRTMRSMLVAAGYEVANAQLGDKALKLIQSPKFDLILLDTSRQIELCREIRAHGFKRSIIVVTLPDSGQQGLEALDAGADDFVAKPLNRPEVLARIRATLRNSAAQSEAKVARLRLGDVEIDFATRRVLAPDGQARLTPKEFDLLSYLAANANRTITYGELLEAVWSSAKKKDSLRVMIERLRKKIERSPGNPEYLLTHPWVGYRMRLPT